MDYFWFGGLILSSLLIVPIALYVSRSRVLLGVLALAMLCAFVLLSASYFWPLILLPLGTLIGAYFHKTALELDSESAPQPEAVIWIAGIVGAWFLVFAPALLSVIPILPADSPVASVSLRSLGRDFAVNAGASLFVLPWLCVGVGGLWLGCRRRSKTHHAR
jgi:hypothetical protein